MSKCYGCKQDVSGIGLVDLVFTWQEFVLGDGPELLEVPRHKLCYANELSEYNIDNLDATLARAERAEAALERAEERVVSEQTATEKLVIDRMERNYSIPRHTVAALLNIIRYERVARMQAEALWNGIPWKSIVSYFTHGDYGPDEWMDIENWIKENAPTKAQA